MSKKGSILIISLWIAAILVLFTFGLAHRASLNLKIARNQKNNLKAYNLAKAGINKAIMLTQEDSLNNETKHYDTVLECGVNLNDREPREIFSENLNSTGESFQVGFYGGDGEFVYGMRDEESKINVACVCLDVLLEQRQVEGGAELAQTIHSWIDQESTLDDLGSREIPKKEPLQAPEELILVLEYFFTTKDVLQAREKAKEEYEKFKDFVTIYGDNKINVNTTTAETLDVLASAFARQNNLKIDTYALAQRIIELRDNPSRKYYKNLGQLQQDLQQDQNLDVEQKGFFTSFLLPFLKCRCDYLKINSSGHAGGIVRQINMVYDRLAKKAVYWHEN